MIAAGQSSLMRFSPFTQKMPLTTLMFIIPNFSIGVVITILQYYCLCEKSKCKWSRYVKEWILGLTQSQKLAHRVRIVQIHMSRPIIVPTSDVGLLTLPRMPDLVKWSMDKELWWVWLWYHVKEWILGLNSTPKASSWGEDCPTPYKKTNYSSHIRQNDEEDNWTWWSYLNNNLMCHLI